MSDDLGKLILNVLFRYHDNITSNLKYFSSFII